jgi:alkylhydroperoxidase/carboxymuconolactone decarboxylase family protein YurZ
VQSSGTACLGEQPDQLQFDLGVSLRHGVDRAGIAGILILVQAYAGLPRANSAATIALEVVAKDS